MDLEEMEPTARVLSEIKILKHHTSELKSVDMAMTVDDATEALDARLARLAAENELTTERTDD